MADEHGVLEFELLADLQYVPRVPAQGRVAGGVERRVDRAAGADLVEQDHPMGGRERRPDQSPHVLIAPEPVREDQRGPVGAAVLDDVVAHGGHEGLGDERLRLAHGRILRTDEPAARLWPLDQGQSEGRG